MFASKPTEGSIVGLDVGGTLFYFHASVLLQAGSPYLDELLSGSAAYTDERKRQIFFVDRPPRRFEYVRDYLVTGNLNLPEDDNVLRRNLREEAKFFGLKGLEDILKVSRTITPDKSNKGVLHWLGTERGKANYTNPYTLGAVHVGAYRIVLYSVPYCNRQCGTAFFHGGLACCFSKICIQISTI